MTEHYQVTLYSQMGPRPGTLTLHYDGSYVSGSLELVGYCNRVRGVRAEDGKLHLFHPIQTAVSTFSCETVLGVSGGQLTGETSAQPCRMRWEGVQIPPGQGPCAVEESKP